MAFSTVGIIVLIFSGISIFFLVLFFLAKLMGVNLFDAINELYKPKQTTLLKTSVIPEEELFRITYPKYNFSHMVKGGIEVGKNEETGKTLIRFKYGNGQITNWTIPKDAVYFRVNLDKLLSGKKPLEFVIVDDDDIVNLRQEVDRLLLYTNMQKSKIDSLMENEKLRLQKMLEYQRNARNIAFGWSGATPQSSLLPYRPWAPYRSPVTPITSEYEEGII